MKNVFKKIIVSTLALAVIGIGSVVPNTESPVALTTSAAEVSIQQSSTQDRSNYFTKRYNITGNNASDIVSVATAQLGRTGSSLKYSEQWCANFVNDCAKNAKISSNVIPHTYSNRGSCIYLYRRLVNNCNATTVNPSNAKAGDIIFFDWSGRKNINNTHHVAIVTGVRNGRVYYIGGNQGSEGSLYKRKVTNSSYSVNSGYIAKVVRPRYASNVKYFQKYTGKSGSFVDALKSIGVNSSYSYRKQIATANGISNYSGTASQNSKMLSLLKSGKLRKP